MIPLHAPILNLRELVTFPKEDYVAKLKKLLATTFDKEGVLFTTSGRNAIYLALKAMKLNPDDEVIIPGHACDAVRVSIEAVCQPVCVDIDPETFNIDPGKISRRITKKTRAILVAHLYGNPCPMKEITDIAGSHNLALIEDVAQALYGKYDNQMLGSFGDFAMFSFRFSKDVTCFRGGVLLAREKLNSVGLKPVPTWRALAQLSAIILAMGQIKRTPSKLYSALVRNFLDPSFSRNAAKFSVSHETLANYQCYLLYQQMGRMEQVIRMRRENAGYFPQRLKDVVGIPTETNGGKHTYFRYAVQSDRRDELYHHLLKRGIEADKTYDHSLATNGTCPHSDTATRRKLAIPVHQELSQQELDKIVGAIREFSK